MIQALSSAFNLADERNIPPACLPAWQRILKIIQPIKGICTDVRPYALFRPILTYFITFLKFNFTFMISLSVDLYPLVSG